MVQVALQRAAWSHTMQPKNALIGSYHVQRFEYNAFLCNVLSTRPIQASPIVHPLAAQSEGLSSF